MHASESYVLPSLCEGIEGRLKEGRSRKEGHKTLTRVLLKESLLRIEASNIWLGVTRTSVQEESDTDDSE